MKNVLLGTVALLCIATTARADDLSDIKQLSAQLKEQNETLRKQNAQNQALVRRISELEKRQGTVKARPVAQAVGPEQTRPQWNAADLAGHIPAAILTGSGPLTWNGITLYGGIDVGVAYQTHGTPLSQYYSPGLEYLISKNSNHSILSFAPNALSQSNVGLKGVEELIPGLSAVFNTQVAFNPQSGLIPDNLKSTANQNGVPLNQQISGGDSHRAGQAFVQAYGGLSSPTYGTLTFGRQNTLILDGVLAYDPMGGSNAFSVVGYQGATSGAGDTEDKVLDNSLKYRVNYGPVRAAAFYKFGPSGSANSNAYQGQLGFDYKGFSFDAIGSHINDAVSASPLSAAQVAALTSPVYATGAPGVLDATISDNTSFMLLARYETGPFKLYAAYENIRYQNPNIPLNASLTNPVYTIGGYLLNPQAGGVSNTAYNNNKVLQVFWGGVKYAFRPNVDITAAYYHEDQNSFSGSSNAATYGCSSNVASNCKGTLDAASLLVDYRFTKRFDMYGGAMYSTVSNGLANGFLFGGTIDPTIGARFQF